MLKDKLRTCLVTILIMWTYSSSAGAAPSDNSRYIREVATHDWVIVFVHGISGDAKSSWSNGDVYWPELLSKDKDFDGASIYVYEYLTAVLGNTFSINEVAENMRLIFNSDHVSAYSNIVFIAHSMGGIAVRNYLLKYRPVADHVRMIYFFSTPTTGSEIANLVGLIKKNPQTSELKIMDSVDYLANVQRDWLAAGFNIPSYCAYERRPTYGVLVVTQASATNLCNKALDPIDADHISIVKPSGPRDIPYLAFKAAYQQVKPRADLVDPNAVMLQDTTAAAPDKMFEGDPASMLFLPPYQLKVNVHVSFQTAAFNQLPYLAGLNHDIQVTDLLGDEKAGVGPGNPTKLVSREALKQSEEESISLGGERFTGLDYQLVVDLPQPPEATRTFTFSVGPRKWHIRFGDLRWRPRGVDGTHWLATAKVSLLAQDPDWIIIHDSRFLKIQQAKGKNPQAVLETIVENRTPTAFAVNELVIIAYGRKLPKCAALPNENTWEPPAEKVVINWPRILDKLGGAPKGERAWVELGHEAVPVKIMFREATCFKFRAFRAAVPVNLDIPPREVGRIRLSVTNVPGIGPRPNEAVRGRMRLKKAGPQNRNSPWLELDEPIAPVWEWPDVRVSIQPEELVSPRYVAVH
jgi:pimeloyl-ACP methyl ester carboxylesterase